VNARKSLVLLCALAVLVADVGVACSSKANHSSATSSTSTTTASGSATAPPSTGGAATNIYANIGPDHLSPAIAQQPARVYVPNGRSNTVTIIDQASKTVVGQFATGAEPQHIVPSYDLSTLWVLLNSGYQVQPIDPATSTPGAAIPVDDPYNMYFTYDGSSAIVVAEARQRLDFRDPHTMALQSAIDVKGCAGINHADYNADGTYLIVTCEFAGRLAKIDMTTRTVVGMLDLGAHPVAGQPHPMAMAMPTGGTNSYMPQDVRAAPDGHHFYVADMLAGGVFVVDGDSFTVTKFIPTGIGAHGITPSRDGTRFFIANRGSDQIDGPPHGPGSVSVLDTTTDTVVATWDVPGGGSPDMGNVNAAGTELWLSGRFDSEVYVFDTVHGGLMTRIPVGAGPHGLTVWPQAGRFSLGHTGNMR